jgi:tetratricopeptide (TPR) repeat protein/predicted DNA-binding protein
MFKQKFLRLAVKLPEDLEDHLRNEAAEIGITMSDVLRQLLLLHLSDSIKHDLYLHRETTSLSTFTFRIPINLNNQLSRLANEHSLPKSFLIRTILYKHYNQEIPEASLSSYDNETYLHNSGSYQELINLLTQRLDVLSDEHLIMLANAYERIGKLEFSNQILLSIGNSSPSQKNIMIKARLIELQIAIFKSDIRQAQYLLTTIKNELDNNTDRKLKSLWHYLSAEYYRAQDNINLALDNYEMSLDYLDVITYPAETAEVYLRLASLWIYLANFDTAERCLIRTKKALLLAGNNYYWGQFYNSRGLLTQMQGEQEKGNDYLMQSITYSAKNNSVKEFTYGYENLARLALVRKDYSSAHRYLTKSDEMEQKFRPGANFNRTRLFRLFIYSQDDYATSIRQLNEILSKSANLKPNLVKYILYTAQFLHGDITEKHLGEAGLKSLVDNGSYQLVRLAARNTLQESKLQSLI